MRLLAVILTLCTSLYAQSPASEWAQMSQAQQDSIRATYDYFKPYDLGFTAAANKWRETDGIYFISIRVDSTGKVVEIAVGGHQIRIDQALSDSTGWEISRLAEKHISDLEFHRQEVLKRWQALRKQYDGDWEITWSHWNSGNGPYGRDMRDKVRFLSRLGWK